MGSLSEPGKPCPQCQATGTLSISVRMVAKPVGTYSLAGQSMKVGARWLAEAYCSACQMRLQGQLVGVRTDGAGRIVAGHFEVLPDDAPAAPEPGRED